VCAHHTWCVAIYKALSPYNSISTRRCSMCLIAFPLNLSLGVNDQSFQDAARAYTEVRSSPLSPTAGRPCGPTIEDDNVEHKLSCNQLNGLMQSHRDDTVKALRDFVGYTGSFSRVLARSSRPTSRTSHCLEARCDLNCDLRPGPDHVLIHVSFSHPQATPYFLQAACNPSHVAA
jgi:hypothetical protein